MDDIKEYLEYIRVVRAETNDFWMGILEIALMENPNATKELLKKIRRNDQTVRELIGKIIDHED